MVRSSVAGRGVARSITVAEAACAPPIPADVWFLDRLLVKHGDPAWTFEPGYPLLDQIILYEQKIEIMTGKQSFGLRH